jgi:flagellar biosynthesis/type III secretory pathway protein FliH
MGIWQQRIAEGVARGRAEGREEGRAAGRAAGRAEGRASLILMQLAARFGALPSDVVRRVHDADEATAMQWAPRILSAQSLGEVFEDG